MNKRENYITLLKKGKAGNIVWAPNFDHWYNVNTANGTLPEEYRGMSRNDIVRAVGAAIWSRTVVLKANAPDVEVHTDEIPGKSIRTVYRTPVGTVETLHLYAGDFSHALFLKEHMIKRVEDIRVVKYIVENTRYALDVEPFIQSENAVGEDGISLVSLPYAMPYIQFGRTAAGWERGIYLWNDHTEEVEDLMDAYAGKSEECARLLVKSPSLVIHSDDNMDELTTPPSLFRRYAIPYYKRIAGIVHDGGKILETHWCGKTEHLLPLVKECGIDVVEAVSIKPMAGITLPEVLDTVGENVVVQGGIPSIMMCPQGASRKELELYVRDLLNKIPIGYRCILGMGDNVPPDADFYRVKMISDIVGNLPGKESAL